MGTASSVVVPKPRMGSIVETWHGPAKLNEPIPTITHPHGAGSLKVTKQDPLPEQPRYGACPSIPPQGPGGAPTLETVMGFPKSLPPVMRKPHGAGPGRVMVTGMAAGGWAGAAGSGHPGCRGDGAEEGPCALHGDDGAQQRLPSGEGTRALALSQGAGSFLLLPRCPQPRLLVASSPSSPPLGPRGARLRLQGMEQPRSPGPWARQEIGAGLATARPNQRGLRGGCGWRGEDPAAHQGCKNQPPPFLLQQTHTGKGC